MEHLSFNNLTVELSSTPPFVNTSLTAFPIEITVQGPTTVILDYSLLNFSIKPFKNIVFWNPGVPETKEIYNVDFSTVDDVPWTDNIKYTFNPTSQFQVISSIVMLYYQNGVIHQFNMKVNLLAYNIIDLDLRLVDTQLVNNSTSIYNIESQQKEVLFNQVTQPS